MAVRSDRPIEVKASPFEGIGFDEQDGIIEGIAAVTGNVDLDNERIVEGAFTRTIADRKAGGLLKLPMGLDHDLGFGVTLDLEEVSRAELPASIRAVAPDATGGLYAKGQVVMSDANIARLGELRGRARPPGMSITYRVMAAAKAGMTPRGQVTDLLELSLNEWGPQIRLVARNSAARVTGMKSGDVEEKGYGDVAGSYEDLRSRVFDAVKAAGLFSGSDTWVSSTLPGYVIVMVSYEDRPQETYRIDYAEMSGQVALGAVTPVQLQTVVTTKAADEAALLERVGRFAVDVKAGRVLSARNLEELSAAIEALQRIREAAAGAGASEGEQPAAKAAEAPTDLLRLLGSDLDLLSARLRLASIGG